MDQPTFVKGFHDEEKVKKMTYRPFGKTGLNVSKMALGGAALGGVYESMTEEEGIEIVKEAVRSGINLIDTAPWYGQGKSETLLGKALKEVPRDAYYITTKVGRYEPEIPKMFDFSADRVLRSVDHSLKLLGLDYVDIIQIHDVEFSPTIEILLNETLPALEKVVKQGKARFIGITGYALSTLKNIIERSTVKIDSVLSYTRNTLVDDELLNYIPFFQEKEIGVIDAAILSMGLLSEPGPQPWHYADADLRRRVQEAIQFSKDNGSNISHLAIQYSISQPGISTSLIGAGSLEFLKKNIKAVTTSPTEKEKELIKQIKEKFFSGEYMKNWEGVELKRYWNAMKDGKANFTAMYKD